MLLFLFQRVGSILPITSSANELSSSDQNLRGGEGRLVRGRKPQTFFADPPKRHMRALLFPFQRASTLPIIPW